MRRQVALPLFVFFALQLTTRVACSETADRRHEGRQLGRLGSPPHGVDPVLVQLGPLQARWYGIAHVAGLLVGWWYVVRLTQRPYLWHARKPVIDSSAVGDLVIWVLAGVIIGGRLGYVLFYGLFY